MRNTEVSTRVCVGLPRAEMRHVTPFVATVFRHVTEEAQMPRKPTGERALTGAEREAKRRERVKQDHALAEEAMEFLLTIEDEDIRSMRWEQRKKLRDLQSRARSEKAYRDVYGDWKP